MRSFLADLLGGWGVPNPLVVALISALPVLELRAGIPLGRLVLEMSPLSTWAWGVAGNLAPLPLVFWIPGVFDRFCSADRLPWMRRLMDRLYARTRRRHTNLFLRLQDLALVALVAIPFPLTGGWTGVLAAYVFGVPFRRAIWLITLGVAIAGALVLLLVEAGLLVWGSG